MTPAHIKLVQRTAIAIAAVLSANHTDYDDGELEQVAVSIACDLLSELRSVGAA